MVATKAKASSSVAEYLCSSPFSWREKTKTAGEWQAILRQFWRYVRPTVNPKDGFDFNEILWSFLDQSRRWGQELQTLSPFIASLAILYHCFRVAKGLL